MRRLVCLVAALLATTAQAAPVSQTELRATIERLVGFGTRHTLSDTQSETRGIGAARRFAAARFAAFSKDCGGCLIIETPAKMATSARVPVPAEIINVMAILPGTSDPGRVVIMSAGPRSEIIGDYPVPLERPRDVGEIRHDPRFRQLLLEFEPAHAPLIVGLSQQRLGFEGNHAREIGFSLFGLFQEQPDFAAFIKGFGVLRRKAQGPGEVYFGLGRLFLLQVLQSLAVKCLRPL